jgi:phosphoribosylaminoimidazole-succinocarboxamide synthase
MNSNPITQGKTKIIYPFTKTQRVVRIQNKNDITAGNGKRHEIIPQKGELSTRITCNVFDLFVHKKIPCAYIGRDTRKDSFIAQRCTMIPVEVVVRRYAEGSYNKRYPHVHKGTKFSEPVVEYFLKTTNQVFGDMKVIYDDPLLEYDTRVRTWSLYSPDEPRECSGRIGLSAWNNSIGKSDYSYVMNKNLSECKTQVLKAFEILEYAWNTYGGILQDAKFEFGFIDGKIVLADVVDCDSWRVFWSGIQLSKQGFRNGDTIEDVRDVYTIAASITDHFPFLP